MTNKQPSGIKPGIYFNLSNEEYHSDSAISCSNIKDLLISPLKYWNNSPLNPDRKRKETTAKSTGTALHCLLMEKEKFKQDYIVLPKLEIDSDFYRKESQNPDFLTKYALRKTKDAKTFEYIGSQTVIKEEDFEEIKAAISSFEAQSAAGALFQDGYAEVSIFWQDEETGLMCKCRPDYLTPNYIADYKSIADIEKIGRDLVSYKYHFQAAYYLEGMNQFRKYYQRDEDPFTICKKLNELTKIDHNNFIFAFQEKEAPYLVRLKTLSEEVLDIGRQKFRLGLEIYKENIEKYGVGKWEDNYRRGDEGEIQIMGLVNLPSYIQYM
jgi:exodeoxyribonuclease VIII